MANENDIVAAVRGVTGSPISSAECHSRHPVIPTESSGTGNAKGPKNSSLNPIAAPAIIVGQFVIVEVQVCPMTGRTPASRMSPSGGDPQPVPYSATPAWVD